MPAHHGEDIWELFGEFDGSMAAFQVRPDTNDFGDARRIRPGHYLREIIREIRIFKMRVRIEEDWRHRRRGPARILL